MKTLAYFILMFGLFQNTATNSVLEGKSGIGYRVYINSISTEKIIAEFGGTSMKLGGNYILLTKVKENSKGILAESSDKKSYVFKKNKNLFFRHVTQSDETFTFKLSNKGYDEKMDRNRFNIFRMYFRDKYRENSTSQEEQKDFDKFKLNTIEYLELNSGKK